MSKVAKQLTSKSGITIPKQLRAETGFHPGMGVDLEVTDQGILLTPHRPVCRLCGTPEQVIHVSGIDLCRNCAAQIVKEVERHEH